MDVLLILLEATHIALFDFDPSIFSYTQELSHTKVIDRMSTPEAVRVTKAEDVKTGHGQTVCTVLNHEGQALIWL